MRRILLPALRLLLVLSALTGVAYPLMLTGVACLVLPAQAGGSLVRRHGQVVGSTLLAQRFTERGYLWPRPSAVDYATLPSGASNAGPTNAAWRDAVRARATAWRATPGVAATTTLPPDLLYASGSGLDPHLSPAAARLQVERVAAARGLEANRIGALVESAIEPPQWGFLGETRINVLRLNVALDQR